MKRFLISIAIVAGLYELLYTIVIHFEYIHRSSFAYGIGAGIIVIWITEWIVKKFDKAEELEELEKQVETEIKEKKEKNEISKINHTDVS